MNELAAFGSRLSFRWASPAHALCVALVAASAAIGEAPPAERAEAGGPTFGSRAVESAEQVRHGVVELRRELWRVEEMLALTPIEVGEAIAGAEQARERMASALLDLQARGSRPELATDPALREELDRARGELSALRARLDRRIARRAEVGPPAPLAPPREAGDLEIIATSPHATCEKALEIGPGRVRGILRPETWFRVHIPKPMRVAFRAESLDEDIALSLHERCGAEARAGSRQPSRIALTLANFEGGEVWVRLIAGSTNSRGHQTFTLESVLGAGAIAGRVTRVSDGTGVRSAQIQVFTEQGVLWHSVYTGDDGQYLVSGLVAGSYRVSVSRTGDLAGELYDDRVCAGGPPAGCLAAGGDPVVVQDSATTSGVDFQLVVGGRLGGHVRHSPEGTIPDSSTVRVLNGSGEEVAAGFIDALGRFSISGLHGEYRATAAASGRATQLFDHVTCFGGCAVANGTPISVGPGLDRPDINFDLLRLGAISGRLTDLLGNPITNGAVLVRQAGFPSTEHWLTLAADGTYLADGLAPGLYHVAARPERFEARVWGGAACTYSPSCLLECDYSSGTPISVEAETTTEGIDFSLRPFQSIGGFVTREEDGTPLPGVLVKSGDGFFCSGSWDESDLAGSYRLEAAAPRAHRLFTENALDRLDEVFDGFTCAHGGCSWTGGPYTPVPVTLDGPTEGVNFSLAMAGSIHGFVCDFQGQGIGSCTDGRVDLYGAGGGHLDYTCLASDGSFSFGTLPPGSYLVGTTSPGYIDERYDNIPCEGSCVAGTPIVLTTGEERHGIDFVLDRYGRIRGTVHSADPGYPCIYGFDVSLRNAAGTVLTTSRANDTGAYSAIVTSGEPVFVTSQASRCERSLYPGLNCPGQLGVDCLLSSGVPITVGLNEEAVGIDFALRGAPTVRGRVLQAPDGRPAPGAVVDFFDGVDQSWVNSVPTDGAGNYLFYAWAPAPGLLVATDNGFGAIDEIWRDVPCPNGPAWFGLCDLALATPVQLREYEVVDGIDFVLSAWPVFKNGFENGSLVGWSGAESQ